MVLQSCPKADDNTNLSIVGSTPGCGRSNLGSNPGILPNIVHQVQIPGRSTGTWEQNEVEQKYIYKFYPRVILEPDE